MTTNNVGYADQVILHNIIATAAAPSGVFPLGGGNTGTGQTFAVAGRALIRGMIFTDQAGTCFVEQMVDGINFDISTSIPIVAGTALLISETVSGTACRVRIVNGGVAQTLFRSYVAATIQ